MAGLLRSLCFRAVGCPDSVVCTLNFDGWASWLWLLVSKLKLGNIGGGELRVEVIRSGSFMLLPLSLLSKPQLMWHASTSEAKALNIKNLSNINKSGDNAKHFNPCHVLQRHGYVRRIHWCVLAAHKLLSTGEREREREKRKGRAKEQLNIYLLKLGLSSWLQT